MRKKPTKMDMVTYKNWLFQKIKNLKKGQILRLEVKEASWRSSRHPWRIRDIRLHGSRFTCAYSIVDASFRPSEIDPDIEHDSCFMNYETLPALELVEAMIEYDTHFSSYADHPHNGALSRQVKRYRIGQGKLRKL